MVGCRAEGFGFCRDCHPEGKWDGTLVDEVWVVDAPKDIRVARVMVRNNMPEEDVRKRIDSQNDNPKFSVPTSVVENYGSNSVIVQVQNLLKTMFNKQNTK